LYTAADFELDERHMIKNEKVALDRLRVRQNVSLVVRKSEAEVANNRRLRSTYCTIEANY